MSEQNLLLARDTTTVDEINSHFYARFPYPQRPMSFDYLEDRGFERLMLAQDLGDWSHETLPHRPEIWVAGCGANQAVMTALRFPNGAVLGTDLSVSSIALTEKTAAALAIGNLTVRRESINEALHRGRFDYILCTGVIHHNAYPAEPLACLARALKPGGVLELMVYNRFHWTLPAAFQQAVRTLGGIQEHPDFDREFALARRLMDAFPTRNAMASYLDRFRTASEEVFADALLQPVLHSYTLSSLVELAAGCGLSIAAPCFNIYDRAAGSSWELEFPDGDLQACYDALPDLQRWQVTNLLALDRSPFLWFYLQRQDSPRPIRSAREMADDFLKTIFRRAETVRHSYCPDNDGVLRLSPVSAAYPSRVLDERIRAILEAVDGHTPIGDILGQLGIAASFQNVNSLRLRLATSAFPYLVAAAPEPAVRERRNRGLLKAIQTADAAV